VDLGVAGIGELVVWANIADRANNRVGPSSRFVIFMLLFEALVPASQFYVKFSQQLGAIHEHLGVFGQRLGRIVARTPAELVPDLQKLSFQQGNHLQIRKL